MGRIAAVSALLGMGSLASAAPRDTQADTWEATDGLGRALPTHAEAGEPNQRLVLAFYYIWHQRNAEPQPFDISKIIAGKAQPWIDATWGPSPAFHWWGEPALGYYDINDEFVLRRHAQQLSDAGVDAIVIDVTNAATYDPTWKKLCATYQSLRDAGNRTPNIAFIAHSSSDATVQHLYDELYAKQECKGLWQLWQDKPLMLALPGAGLSAEAKAFFTFRDSWAWSAGSWFGDGRDKWPWLDDFPQKFGWHVDAHTPEAMPVGVAQHPTGNYGRSHHAGMQPGVDANYLTPDTAKGLGFQEQWDTVLAKKPQVAFVTQWNEWLAQRFVTCGTHDTGATQFLGKPLECGDTHFIDEFNEEFSRDIEPMNGGYGDAYYYQLIGNVRRFKGARAVPAASPAKTITAISDLEGVEPEYLDDRGDVTHRDALGYSGPDKYVDNAGRNDIDSARVSRDAARLYFYVHTTAPLSPTSDPSWMVLWIDSDSDASTGSGGFDRRVSGTTIEAWTGTAWKSTGSATRLLGTNELMLSVPREALALPATGGALGLRFQWRDAESESGAGDTAPNGRFMYRYRTPLDIDSSAAAGSGGMAGSAPSVAGAPSAAAGALVAGAGAAPDAGSPSTAGAAGASDDSGCGCSFSTREPTTGWSVLALAALVVLRRRASGPWRTRWRLRSPPRSPSREAAL